MTAAFPRLALATLLMLSCRPWDDQGEELQVQREDSGIDSDSGDRLDSANPQDSGDAPGPEDTGPPPDLDQDGDGYDALDAGGTDCNDESEEVHPRAGDMAGDWVDGDCDGLDCEASLSSDGVYFVVCPSEMTWEAAATVCIDAGYGGLALIENTVQQEQVEVLSEALSTDSYRELWFGINDRDEEGTWTWMMGSSSYDYWLSGQPGSESDDSDCGMMGNYDGYRWSDLPCSDLYRFACSG